MSHGVWLHVKLVDVADGRNCNKFTRPWLLLLHDDRLVLVSGLESIELLEHLLVIIWIITDRRELNAGADGYK